MLAAAVDAAPPSLRGFHPFGSPDPSGFAAMACDELLVHGRDAALGLGREFGGDAGLASSILARLYPWHPLGAGDDPWQVLLWANGRRVARRSRGSAAVALALRAAGRVGRVGAVSDKYLDG